MTDANKLAELAEVLAELVDLLQGEGELRSFPWVVHAQRMASEARSNPDAILGLKSMIRSVPTGAGSLYDLVVWRSDFDERKHVNQRLDSLRWLVLDLIKEL